MIRLEAKCDRCGESYKPYFPKKTTELDDVTFNGVMLVTFDADHNYRRKGNIDFCPSCSYKFHVWLEGETDGENESDT